MTDRYVVEPGKRIRLDEFGPSETHGADREKSEGQMTADLEQLASLQELLYVASANAVLVILQGTDTSGKDGTVRHVFRGVSPLGCSVSAFGVPTPGQLAHDYLWRIHMECPPKGMLTIFNRSHYESVLVELVHGIVNEKRVRERYDEINAFERMLTREGTIILKFFLHISKSEQEGRLRERMDDPDKQWKVNPGDWEDRERWDAFQNAYEDLLNHTSTDWAPWTIVPADRKWYRNLVVARRIIDVLGGYEGPWKEALHARGQEQMAEMREWRKAREK